MCGILAYFGTTLTKNQISPHFNKIKYRGPDNSQINTHDNHQLYFHRLSIMGLDDVSNQPLNLKQYPSLSLICNGELYNYNKLTDNFNFSLETNSDCEIILHLYNKFGIEKTLNLLDGVFMFALYDSNQKILICARDPFGVRPGFMGVRKNNEYLIASEAKAISDICDDVKPFPPGHYWLSETDSFKSYYQYEYPKTSDNEESILDNTNILLNRAVEKRMMSDREIGCLLSGGLDSSLICSLVKKYYTGKKLSTFSIGMEGSIDLEYATKVAQYLNTSHHNVLLNEDDFFRAIEEVIYKIESFDITTVRASVGNYLVSKYIKENSDCIVIFNGDGSDEVCCGYQYFSKAPSEEDMKIENYKLLQNIYLFDVLRSDRSISSNGLEPRTPFLDKDFVSYYMSIPYQYKTFNNDDIIEKRILRQAFSSDNLLPNEVLWRKKCAFSDGVSNIKNSWHNIIKSKIDQLITDSEFEKEAKKIHHCTPITKESYYYRKIYNQIFEKHQKLIPYFWLPNWTNTMDPSARELNNYKE